VIAPRDPWVPVSPGQWEELRRRWPHPYRLVVAMRLARDVETCAELLCGEPVDPDRLDREALRWASERLLVRLDFHALDLLLEDAA
jgi:hypothetical protein